MIHYTVVGFSLGAACVGCSDAGVCAVLIADTEPEAEALLAEEFPAEERVRDDEVCAQAAQAVLGALSGERADELVLDLRGTDFQLRVWDALRDLPPGGVVTYSQLAERVGAPTATRAVASACGANHVAVVIPCHRVVRADGGIGGYKWGIERKRRLLEMEREAATR